MKTKLYGRLHIDKELQGAMTQKVMVSSYI